MRTYSEHAPNAIITNPCRSMKKWAVVAGCGI